MNSPLQIPGSPPWDHPDVTKYQHDPEADWSLIKFQQIPPVRIENQAQGDLTSLLVLQGLRKLETFVEFEPWLAHAAYILKSHGLENIIDIRVPRPKTSDFRAQQWYHRSKEVRNWLYFNMSTLLYRHIERQGFNIILADEFVHVARMVCYD